MRTLRTLRTSRSPVLACSVRGCGLALEQRERTLLCPRGHSYDVARSGYVNLLQPQDRRSLASGDSNAAVDARARLLSSGVGGTIVSAFVERAASLIASDEAVVVDLGCGSGEVLGELVRRRAVTAIGVDLSTAAAETASRRFPGVTWVVANADRRLPVLDRSVDLILSFNGRRNPEECTRVLTRGGALLTAVPGADDLIELREQVMGGRLLRARADALIDQHKDTFTVAEHVTLRERHVLDADQLRDVLRATYRGARASAAPRLDRLSELEVTFACDVVLFRPRSSQGRPRATRQAQGSAVRRRRSERA